MAAETRCVYASLSSESDIVGGAEALVVRRQALVYAAVPKGGEGCRE